MVTISTVSKMKYKEAISWLNRGEQRERVFLAIVQPLTADQISLKLKISLDSSSSALRSMTEYGLLRCLNLKSRTSRLYWFTESGINYHRRLLKQSGRNSIDYTLPDVDWGTYGWTCYRHRSAVLKVMRIPLNLRRRVPLLSAF